MTTDEKVRLCCEHLRLHQYQLALKAGLSLHCMGKLMRGASRFQPAHIHALSLALGVSGYWLSDDAREWPPEQIQTRRIA